MQQQRRQRSPPHPTPIRMTDDEYIDGVISPIKPYLEKAAILSKGLGDRSEEQLTREEKKTLHDLFMDGSKLWRTLDEVDNPIFNKFVRLTGISSETEEVARLKAMHRALKEAQAVISNVNRKINKRMYGDNWASATGDVFTSGVGMTQQQEQQRQQLADARARQECPNNNRAMVNTTAAVVHTPVVVRRKTDKKPAPPLPVPKEDPSDKPSFDDDEPFTSGAQATTGVPSAPPVKRGRKAKAVVKDREGEPKKRLIQKKAIAALNNDGAAVVDNNNNNMNDDDDDDDERLVTTDKEQLFASIARAKQDVQEGMTKLLQTFRVTSSARPFDYEETSLAEGVLGALRFIFDARQKTEAANQIFLRLMYWIYSFEDDTSSHFSTRRLHVNSMLKIFDTVMRVHNTHPGPVYTLLVYVMDELWKDRIISESNVHIPYTKKTFEEFINEIQRTYAVRLRGEVHMEVRTMDVIQLPPLASTKEKTDLFHIERFIDYNKYKERMEPLKDEETSCELYNMVKGFPSGNEQGFVNEAMKKIEDYKYRIECFLNDLKKVDADVEERDLSNEMLGNLSYKMVSTTLFNYYTKLIDIINKALN